MIQGKEVLELVLRFIDDTQGKSGRFDQEEARSQESLGKNGDVEEETEDGEENGGWVERRVGWNFLGAQIGKYTSYFIS